MNLKDLDTLIPQYAQNKSEMDSYKKLCDKENAQIKSIMKDLALQFYEAGDYRANYSVSKRETLNEEKLLELAKNNVSLIPCVKTKEYIDFDVLEKLLYDEMVPPSVIAEMDKAKEVKEVVTLRISKKKEKTNDD